MVDALAHRSDAEVNATFKVLYQQGARIDREGGLAQSCLYRITLRDRSVHSLGPGNLVAEDFDDPRRPDEGPAVEGRQDLAKPFTGGQYKW